MTTFAGYSQEQIVAQLAANAGLTTEQFLASSARSPGITLNYARDVSRSFPGATPHDIIRAYHAGIEQYRSTHATQIAVEQARREAKEARHARVRAEQRSQQEPPTGITVIKSGISVIRERPSPSTDVPIGFSTTPGAYTAASPLFLQKLATAQYVREPLSATKQPTAKQEEPAEAKREVQLSSAEKAIQTRESLKETTIPLLFGQELRSGQTIFERGKSSLLYGPSLLFKKETRQETVKGIELIQTGLKEVARAGLKVQGVPIPKAAGGFVVGTVQPVLEMEKLAVTYPKTVVTLGATLAAVPVTAALPSAIGGTALAGAGAAGLYVAGTKAKEAVELARKQEPVEAGLAAGEAATTAAFSVAAIKAGNQMARQAVGIGIRSEKLRIPVEGGQRTIYRGISLETGFGEKPLMVGVTPKEGKIVFGTPTLTQKSLTGFKAPISGTEGIIIETPGQTAIIEKNLQAFKFARGETEKFAIAKTLATELGRTPSKFVRKEIIPQTETLNPPGVKYSVEEARLAGGKIYGGLGARSQLTPKEARGFPVGDIDKQYAMSQKSTILRVEREAGKLRELGNPVRVFKSAPQEIRNVALGRKAVDVHTSGDVSSALLGPVSETGAFGMPFNQPSVAIGETKTMRLSEEGLRRMSSVFVIRQTPSGESVFFPVERRVKDISKIGPIYRTLAESAGRPELVEKTNKLVAMFPEKLTRLAGSLPMESGAISTPSIASKSASLLGLGAFAPSAAQKQASRPSPVSREARSVSVSARSIQSVSLPPSTSPISSRPFSPSRPSAPSRPSPSISSPRISPPSPSPIISPSSVSPSPRPSSPPRSPPSVSPSPSVPPITPPAQIPPFPFFLRGEGRPRIPTPTKLFAGKAKYKPSLTAITFKLKTTRPPKIVTGLEARAVPTKRGKK